MKDEDLKILQGKIQYFYDSARPVHIKFKKGYWKNGNVIETSSDFFVIDEFLEGNLPVFFLEIENVEEYTKDFNKIEVGDGKGTV